jgi:hypothetical protein
MAVFPDRGVGQYILEFKVAAINAYGLGPYQEPDYTTGAMWRTRPSQPSPAVTQNVGTDVVITWDEPEDNGSPITGYEVLFSQNQIVMPQTPSEPIPISTYVNMSSEYALRSPESTEVVSSITF